MILHNLLHRPSCKLHVDDNSPICYKGTKGGKVSYLKVIFQLNIIIDIFTVQLVDT